MEFILIVGIIVAASLIYIGSIYANQTTEIPESCKQAYLDAQNCSGCSGSGSCLTRALESIKEIKL